ncbi:MAG TPA: hypothetical protein VFW39_12175 [Sphingomicrobium sp.]|nr:hypothetical protein [Sphingomicrobium sp.]
MQKRPTSVTVIAWFVIIGALFTIFSLFRLRGNPMTARMLAHSPVPISVHLGFGIVGVIVALVTGYGMLKGYPWSRWLYIGWSVIGLLFSLLTVPIISVMVISILFLAVIAFFLFRPVANAWFNPAVSS